MPIIDDSDFIPVTKDVRNQLRAEINRTGVTAIRLCKMNEALPPARDVNRWIKGLIRHAPRNAIGKVIAAFATLPDGSATQKPRAGRRHETKALPRIPVTNEMAKHIRAELVRMGLSIDSIAVLTGAPSGLSPRVIKGWLYQETKTTRKDHWEFVMSVFKAHQLPPT